MRASRPFMTALATAISLAAAGGTTIVADDALCVYAAYSVLSTYTFSSQSTSSHSSSSSAYAKRSVDGPLGKRAHPSSNSGASTFCQSKNAVLSVYATGLEYCSTEDLNAGMTYLTTVCKSAGSTIYNLSEIASTATSEYVASLTTLVPSAVSSSTSQTAAVVLQQDYWRKEVNTIVFSQTQDTINNNAGWSMYYFWAGIVGLKVITNIISKIFAWYTVRPTDSNGRQTRSRTVFKTMGALHWAKTYITVPALYGTHHQRRVWTFKFPTRQTSLVIAAFYILAIVMSCVQYPAFSDSISTRSVADQVWRYVATRTATMCVMLLPWIWLFAGRNDFLIWITGWNMEEFNVFHRHVARVAVLEAIVHAIAKTVIDFEAGIYYSNMAQFWMRWGVVTLVAMCCMVIGAMPLLRKHWYDAFVVIHVVLAVIAVVGTWKHVALKQGGEYNNWIWAVVAIWSFDRAMRLVRLAVCNLKALVTGNTKASVSYCAESDVIRVVMHTPSLVKPAAGQHYYLYQPMALQGWENHPFTLGTWSTGKAKSIDEHSSSDSDRKDSMTSSASPVDHNKQASMSFYIRPYDGWTKRMRNKCMQSASGTISVHLLAEGPYGHRNQLEVFDNVLLLIGGTGISAALSYLQDHIRRVELGTTVTTSVKLVWSTKQAAMVQDFASRELAQLMRRADVSVSFFATEADASEKITSDAEGITIGRPDAAQTVHDAAVEAAASNGSLAVLACGPASLADAARAAVHSELKRGMKAIDYFEETYGW